MDKLILLFVIPFMLIGSLGCSKGSISVAPPQSLVDQTKIATLELLARPISINSPGHAYIKITRENELQKMSTLNSYGFYPDKNGKFFSVIRGRGEIRSENEITNLPSITLTTQLNKQQLEMVLYAIEKWEFETMLEFKKYSLTSENCVDFVDKIASEAGLITPTTSFKFPAQYIKELANINTQPTMQ